MTTVVDLEDLRLTEDPEQQNAAFLAAFNSGRGEIFDRLYRDDAISNLSGEPLSGAERTKAITELLAGNPKLESSVRACYVADDTSLIIVDYRLEIPGPDGTTQVIKGICTDVLVREANGEWKMAVDRPVALETTPAA